MTKTTYNDIALYDIFIAEALKADPITQLQIWARFKCGLHLQEIGERTGMSPEAVRRRLYKVTSKVRSRYEKEVLGN